MKKNVIILFIMFLIFPVKVLAEEKCNNWHSQGEEVCITKSYQGFKCEWDGTKKGGSRCYKGTKQVEEEIIKITKCSEIKDHTTCTSSKVDGKECIWKQNACHAATNDGSGETIIVETPDEREEAEENNNQSVVQTPTTNNNVTDFKFCEEDGVLKTFQIVGYLIVLIKVLVPLLLIIFGSIDFGKAMIASDDKAINKAAQMLVIRAAAGVIIFFIPTIINVVVGLISNWSSVESEFAKCSTCLFSPSKCNNSSVANVNEFTNTIIEAITEVSNELKNNLKK